MKKTLFQKAICLLLSVTTLLGVFGITSYAADGKKGSNQDTASSLEDMQSLVGVSSYEDYLAANGDSFVSGLPVINIDLNDMVAGSTGVKPSESDECEQSFADNQQNWANFGDNWENSIYLPSTGQTTWNFKIPEGAASYYYIKIEYYSCITSESSISAIERKFKIDGKAPFDEASYIKLDKSWSFDQVTVLEETESDKEDGVYITYDNTGKYFDDDSYYKIVETVKNGKSVKTVYKMSVDIIGNSMSPSIEQKPQWSTYYVDDSTGYYHGYFRFYLLNGSHQLTLESQREPVIIKSIQLIPYEGEGDSIPSYEQVLQEYAANGYQSASGDITTLEAEFPDFVSDSSVYATNNNTSAQTYPSAPGSQIFNVIGENSYNSVGQWAAYKFTVNESGLYKLSARYLQSTLQGMYICRTIKLSGGKYGYEDGTPTVPFMEAYDVQFNYNKKWQSTFIGDSKGNIFQFYFEEGVEYTIYFEVSLGSLKELIYRAEKSLEAINDCYLRILQLTGSNPDPDINYDFYKYMPDVPRTLLVQAIELMDIKAGFEELCGTNGSHIATLETIAILLDTMGSDEGIEIAANLSNLKSYLGTLGTWINDSKRGGMVVDSFSIVPANATEDVLPRAKSNFFKSLWFEFSSFIYSFFTDYDMMGLTTKPQEDVTETVNVWLATGRDQSNIWRSMIDAKGGFTDRTGHAVTLKLVTAGTLLPSILSGKGPDIYIGLGSADVINYAIRNAVMGVSGGDKNLTQEENEIFLNHYYTYKNPDGTYEITKEYKGEENLSFVSQTFEENVGDNYIQAAMDTVTLRGVSYGLPQTMTFAMMFYRMDVLAELGVRVPETWSELISTLPTFQTNNMEIGVDYISALDFMIYQKGGNMWLYTDNEDYAGAKIGLGTDIALESFEYVCRLYSDYSFPITYDAANRFRTGEMPLLIGGYTGLYNQLVVYATEIEGLWEFCPLPGTEREDGTINYDSLAGVSATVMLHGCNNVFAAWEFMQWQSSAEVQASYGNKMVALIGPSAKYETANINAIKDLSWTARERAAIEDQIRNMSSVVNYPGSYIIARYMKFAFLDAVNDGANPVDAMTEYLDDINSEIRRKREEFDLPVLMPDEDPPTTSKSATK